MNSISFRARNTDIITADKILHKIRTDFNSVSPWKASLYHEKRGFKNIIGAPVYDEKLELFRDSIEPDFMSDYKYAAKIIEGVKHFKAADCKELSEIAYLIAKANGIKNCYCANLYMQTSDKISKLKKLGHSIMLIFRDKVDEGIRFANKFYIDCPKVGDNIIPPRDTIVVDSTFGIADYWNNALQKYDASFFPAFNEEKGKVLAELRQPLLSTDKELRRIKKDYPLLSFTDKTKKMKHNYKFSKEDKLLEKFKAQNPNIFTQNYPVSNPETLKNKTLSFFFTL